ncbi:MAG: hypothetical protein K9G41_00870 [Flavobacteriales bacterium]|nr:hypothetical protein [Flavobacteriales bacterium]
MDTRSTKNTTWLRFFISLLSVCSLTLLVRLIMDGWFYQTQSDTVFPTYIFGLYNGGTNAMPDTFGCFSGISHGLNALYHAGFRNIYDHLQVILVTLCMVYWVFVLLPNNWNSKGPNAFILVPIFIHLSDLVLPFEFSKTAMIVSLTGFHISSNRDGFLSAVFGTLLISIGFCIRPEPVVIMLIMALALFPLQASLKFVKQGGRTLLLAVLAIVGLSQYFLNSDRTPSNTHYKEIRPYEYALVDFRKNDLELTDFEPSDQAKIIAAQSFFFADKEQLNVAYFKSIGIAPIDKSPVSLVKSFFRPNWIADGLKNFWRRTSSIKFHFFTFLLLVLIFWNQHRQISIYLLLITALIVVVSVFLKTEHHFITTIMMAALLLIGTNENVGNSANYSQGKFWALCLFSLVLAGFALAEKKTITQSSSQKHNYYAHVANEVEHLNPNSLVLNISFWDNLHYKLYAPIQPLQHESMSVLDGGILYLNQEYQEIIQIKSGESEFILQFMNFAITKQKIFVSSQKRMDLIIDYLNTVHGTSLRCSQIKTFKLEDQQTACEEIGLFMIKEV